MEVEVRRGRRVQRFRQELLADDPRRKITLQILDSTFEPVRIDAHTTLRPGSILVWHLWPGRPFEIGAFHHAHGSLQGYYVNLIRPPRLQSSPWIVEDLYLDVWVPAGGRATLLDEEDLRLAVAGGELSEAEADGVRELGASVLSGANRARWLPPSLRRWPPPGVRRWPLESVPALRLRRDAPGTFHAARISGRIIALGLYVLGAVSATSAGFAALTPFALGGWLPATRWPEPPLLDERSLFIAALAAGIGVLALLGRIGWATALLPVYAVLGLLSLVFAVCRWWFDREVPVFALGGVAMTLVALIFLL